MIFPSILPEGDVHQFSFDWYNCWFNSIEYLHVFCCCCCYPIWASCKLHSHGEWTLLRIPWKSWRLLWIQRPSSFVRWYFISEFTVSLYIIEYECLANRFFLLFHRYSPFNRKGEVNTNWNWKSFFVSRKKGNNEKRIAFSVWHFSFGIYKDELSRNQEN